MNPSIGKSNRARIALAMAPAIWAALVPAAMASGRDASPEEAAGLIAHATIDFSQGDRHYFEYFAADGASRGGDGVGALRRPGRWRVRPDGTVCFLHDDPDQSGCVFVQARGDSIEFHRVDGVVEGPFRIERGNPHGL
jgi:hypothetical protein